MMNKSGMTRTRASNYIEENQQLQIEGVEQEEPLYEINRRGRGTNNIRDATDVVIERPEVWRVGRTEFDSNPECTKIVSTICKLALNNLDGPRLSFHDFSPDAKLLVLQQFLQRYRWRENEIPCYCRRVLDRIAAKRYAEVLRRCREKCKEQFGWDVDNWKKMVPEWCKNANHWAALCNIWGSEKWRAISEKNKDNRCKSGKVPKHFAGSASAYKHRKNLKQKLLAKGLTRDPTYGELFIHLHVKKKKISKKGKKKQIAPGIASQGNDASTEIEGMEGGEDTAMEFADDKARKTWERVEELKKDPQHVDKPERDLWLMAEAEFGAGSSQKHGRTYGFGSVLDVSLAPPGNTRTRAFNYSHDANDVLMDQPQNSAQVYTREEVERLLEERENKFAEQRAFERADQERKEALNQAYFSQIFAALNMQQGLNVPFVHRTYAMPSTSTHGGFGAGLGSATTLGCTVESPGGPFIAASSTSGNTGGGTFTSLLTRASGDHDYANFY